MQKFCFILFVLLLWFSAKAQPIVSRLEAAWRMFTGDEQLKYALSGICVLNASNGKIVFESNSNIGMTPASTQKIITSVAAFEALGNNYTYSTKIKYNGKIDNGTLYGNVLVEGSGDPTLGSWRYIQHCADTVLKKIQNTFKKWHVDSIAGDLIATNKNFDFNPIPEGWTWGDMGNYYGAGHWGLNWKENQYNIFFYSGNERGKLAMIDDWDDAEPEDNLGKHYFLNQATVGDSNTGDSSIIYSAPYSHLKFIQGSITSGQRNFKVSGALSNGDAYSVQQIRKSLEKSGVKVQGKSFTSSTEYLSFYNKPLASDGATVMLTLTSPPLDSIVYWFLKKSINLYGEALVRTIGLEKKGFGSTTKGIEWIDSFYTANGFDTKSMHLTDGSGLSPVNRITPFAFVKALQFAKSKSWFTAFYNALPIYNDMKLKSGTIHRTKCFAGYHGDYIVSFMVNNYNGSTAALVSKMYKVLNELK